MIGKRLVNTGGAAGAAAFDALANFETVTYTGNGGTQKITGYIRKGAAGFAYNKYITFPDLGGFTSNTSDADGSLSIWINLSSIPSSGGFHTLIGNGGASGVESFRVLVRGIGSSQIKFEFARGFSGAFYSNTTNSDAFTPTLNQWYHLSITYVASTKTVSYYINGASYGSNSLSNQGSFTIGSGFNIGSYLPNNAAYSSYSYNGKVDQFRIFNTTLNSTQVGQLAAEDYTDPKKSTTDYFGDGSGVALYELDENANTTTYYPYGEGAIDSGQSAVFNGSSSYIRATGLGITGNTSFSVSTWINTTSSGIYFLFGDGDDSSLSTILYNAFFIYVNPSGKVVIGKMGVDLYSSSISVNDGSWHNITFTSDGTNSTLYIDGSQSNTTTNTFSIGVDMLEIGRATSNYYYNGKIDQVRIYSSALSTNNNGVNEIQALASETNVPTANLVAHYKLDGNGNDETGSHNGTATSITYSDPAEFPLIAYNGTPTNVNFLGMAFQPDLVWIKLRNTASDHDLIDSVRGATKVLETTNSLAEFTEATNLTSFDTNGFTVGSTARVNKLNEPIVAWCWKAGGAAVLNEEGSIDSQVSANPDAGFSIVKYTGSGSGAVTVGHGLNTEPSMYIVKSLSTGSWWVYNKNLNGGVNPADYFLRLELTNGEIFNGSSGGSIFNSTEPTSSVFSAGTTINGSQNYIAYCFAEVDGYQKVGSYTGATGGVTENIGFQPRWIMIKDTTDSVNHWVINDAVRDTSNPRTAILFPNLSNAEGDNIVFGVNFTSTGFEIPSTTTSTAYNKNGNKYIYLAIA